MKYRKIKSFLGFELQERRFPIIGLLAQFSPVNAELHSAMRELAPAVACS